MKCVKQQVSNLGGPSLEFRGVSLDVRFCQYLSEKRKQMPTIPPVCQCASALDKLILLSHLDAKYGIDTTTNSHHRSNRELGK